MDSEKNKSGFLQYKYVLLAVLALIVVGGVGAGVTKLLSNKGQQSEESMPTFKAQRGPLRISVVESGTIKAREQVIIKNEVEGRVTILTLIPEGSQVSKGDLLIELDSSKLVDGKIDQEISVENADAAFVRARENLAVVENQAQSDVDQAELTLQFAKIDREKYLEGEYPNLLTEAKARITLAEEELQRAEETLKWSQDLFAEKYISQTQLQSDQLAASKKKLDVELAKNSLKLLEEFTYQRQLAELESNVKQAEMALERTKRKASADVVQAKAELRAKESELGRQQDKLAKIEQQIGKCTIHAPADGLVIYATSAKGSWRGNEEPLDEGQEVREREELIYLPTATSVKAEVKVHESSLEKIRIDQPAIVTVDAVPGKVFSGRVAKIAPLPDPQSLWLNPDLTIYDTEIYLDGDGSALRTGMSCKAEIIVQDIEDTVYIPVQAVLRVNGKPTVYLPDGKGQFEPHEVEIGLDNNRMIQIVKGLRLGQEVLLTPPLAPAEKREYMSAEPIRPETGVERIGEVPGREVREGRTSQPRGGPQGGRRRPGQGRPGQGTPGEGASAGATTPTPEQMQKMRERFENMTPEEREKMRQQMMNRRQQSTDGGGGQ